MRVRWFRALYHHVPVGKTEIGISMVATGDEHIRTDQLLAGSHFSRLSGYVTTGQLLVRIISL